MEKLNEFLIKCRSTQLLSNQDLLKLIKLSITSKNIFFDGLNFLQTQMSQKKYNQFLLLFSKVDTKGISAINYLDDHYPIQLRNIYNPPALLFYQGNKNLLLSSCLAIVGSRNATDYSYRCIKGLVPKIIDRYTVVSGLAKGVDTWAHQTALENDGDTIAVIGSPLNVCYPKENQRLQENIGHRGLILSEYPAKTPIKPWHFPQRNRIIAGLSQKVIVTEAKSKSGALITAELALDSNRDVYAIPGMIDSTFSRGCNKLISQGAIPLLDFKEI